MTIIARLFFIAAALGALIYGGLWALATFVEPEQRETSITVPVSSFSK